MFPPRAESVDSFCHRPAMGQPESAKLTSESRKPAEGLFRRTDISPEQFFQTLGRVRSDVRDEIERLIEWLDSTIDVDEDAAVDDGGCDEDTDAEPSLGSFDRMSNQIRAWSRRTLDENDAEEDRADAEPILGASAENERISQEHWVQGNTDDREGDGCADDRESTSWTVG